MIYMEIKFDYLFVKLESVYKSEINNRRSSFKNKGGEENCRLKTKTKEE